MRLFTAINFDGDFKSQIYQAGQSAARHFVKCRLTEPQNIHLTVVFLGEIESDKIPAIKKAMDGCPRQKTEIEICGTGMFRGGDILFLKVKENKELINLYDSLVKNLAAFGIMAENRKYIPHITIAQQARLKNDFDIGKFNRDFKKFCYAARSIELMLSERIDCKMRYTPLYSVKFV